MRWATQRAGVFLVVGVVVFYACGGLTTGVDGGAGAADSASGPDVGCGDGCGSLLGECGDGGACPSGSICANQPAGATQSVRCFPLPACGCAGKTLCECVGACACNGWACVGEDTNTVYCNGPVSRREFKTDISYVSADERAALARETLQTRLAQHGHLGELEIAVGAERTQPDLYGYSSMLLATLQEQQKQIAALTKQVSELERERAVMAPSKLRTGVRVR